MKFSSVSVSLNQKFRATFDDLSSRQGLLPDVRLVSAYRRNVNLRDLLVKAKLPSPKGAKPIKSDPQFLRPEFVSNAQNGKVIKVDKGFSFTSVNCVYLIVCAKCGLKYVGETRNKLSVRFSHHKYNVQHKKDTETLLVQHFILHGVESLRIAGLEKNVFWSTWERKKREKLWIFRLGTREPFGLNMRLG